MSAVDGGPRSGRLALPVTAPVVGFVGTIAGMTGAQLRSVQIVLMEYGPVEVHLAGRAGADEQICEIAERLRLWRMVHPGSRAEDRPVFSGDVEFPGKPEEERFAGIVDAVGMLLAAPRGALAVTGCWTWWTVARAFDAGRPVVLVGPDGSTSRRERSARG